MLEHVGGFCLERQQDVVSLLLGERSNADARTAGAKARWNSLRRLIKGDQGSLQTLGAKE